MPANLDAKIKLVEELAQKLKDAKSIVVVDYRGLNVAEVTELRKNARENQVEYKVYKNTMVRRALDQADIEGLTEYFVGPTAIAISFEDEVAPAKILNDFAKDHKDLEIKAGYVDGNAIELSEVKSLAALPSKETLIAQVLGGINSPISGLAASLNGMISKLAIALGQIVEQKQQSEGAEA